MADNITLPGTAAVVATDDVGSAHHQYVKIEFGADGTATKVDASNPLPVVVISGGDGSVQGVDAHDAAVTADPLTVGGYAKAAAPTDVSADGDAVRAWFLRNGAQCVNVTAAGTLIASGNGTAATALRVTLASDGTGVVTCVGSVAHDASAASAVPVLVGLEARTTDGTAVTSGDAVRALGDVFGKQVVVIGALHELQSGPTSVNFTSNSAADVIAAAGAGIKIAITSILVTNAHATVGTKVTIRDKTTTTRKVVGYAAAAGGGFSIAGARPILISDANSAIEAVCGTTGADVDVTISGYLIKN